MQIRPNIDFEDLVSELVLTQSLYLVALSLYFHQELKDPEYIPTVDIRDTVDDAVGSGIDTGHQLQQLRAKNLVERNADRYRLTLEGLEFCIGRMESLSGSGSGSFLDADVDKRVFRETISGHDEYMSVLDQINRSYRVGVFSGVALLGRGVFEQLTYQLLHDIHSARGDHGMYYDTANSRQYRFSELLSKLIDSYDLVNRHHGALSSKSDLIQHKERIKEIKSFGDMTAHSIRANIQRSDLEPLSEPITETFEVLYTVLKEVNR